MKRFSELYQELDEARRADEKIAVLERYFTEVPPADAAWAICFLIGRKRARLVSNLEIREWTAAAAGLPLWLVEECCEAVGDLAETMALLVPTATNRIVAAATMSLSSLVEERLQPMAGMGAEARRELVILTWRELGEAERFVWNKIMTGGLTVGGARSLVVRALAHVAGVGQAVMAHRLSGQLAPTADAFQRLISVEDPKGEAARSYPFFLASPLEHWAADLGTAEDWRAEWKWDGIRAQLIRRGDAVVLWSRSDELLTGTFPELVDAAQHLAGGAVLDGDVLVWCGNGPGPFSGLQKRLGRKRADTAIQRQLPAVFMAHDLLESGGVDWRNRTLEDRRAEMERVITGAESVRRVEASRPLQTGSLQMELLFSAGGGEAPASDGQGVAEVADLLARLRISPLIPFSTWTELETKRRRSRESGAVGVVLKRVGSTYGAGRVRGDWWKWQVDPFTADFVLVGAEQANGRRSGLFTHYSFAVWRGDELVSAAKAHSGLIDAEIEEVDAFVRANTTGRFGPVHGVKPELVFELGFEGVQESARHQAGIVLRGARILRWCRDKPATEADSMATLMGLKRD
jgi:DNA ligase 1